MLRPLPSYQPECVRSRIEEEGLPTGIWTFSRTMLLHTMQEFDNDFGAGPDKHLALARFFRVVDGIQRIVEDTGFNHVGGREILNSMVGGEVSGRARRSKLACEREECPWVKGSSAQIVGGPPCTERGRLKQYLAMSVGCNVPRS